MKYQPIRYERERSYPMAVAEAWRLLADTDHFNRAIGLPSVEFSVLPDPLIRRAQARAFGVIPVRSLRVAADPAHLFYESQKLRVRAARLLEGLERTLGVRGGAGLQVDFRGARDLTVAIGLAGRRIAVGLAAATAIVGTAVTASAALSAGWATAVFGAVAVLPTGGLLTDVLRRR